MLCEVFLLVTEPTIPLAMETAPGTEDAFDWPRQWFRLTHVCRFWRITAIGFPRLWRCLLLRRGSPVILDLFLQRSRSHPLILTNTGPPLLLSRQQTDYVSELIVTHARRILAIHKLLLSPRMIEGIEDRLEMEDGGCFPILEHLRFIAPFSLVCLPAQLLTPEAVPRLRFLSTGPRFPCMLFHVSPVNNLTHLKLAFSQFSDHRQSYDEWRENLEEFNALEHLVLRNAFEPPDDTENIDFEALPSHGRSPAWSAHSFPHLKTLKLVDDLSWVPCVEFAYEFYCVTRTTLTLIFAQDQYPAEMFSQLHDMARLGVRGGATPFSAGRICKKDQRWILDLWMGAPIGRPHWRVFLYEYRGDTKTHDFLWRFDLCPLNSLALDSVCLILHDPVEEELSGRWWEHFGTIRSLTIYSRHTLSEFLKLARDQREEYGGILMPRLETLILDSVVWEGDERLLTSQLDEFLFQRRHVNAPLKHLKVLRAFKRGRFNPALLQCSVETMEWEDAPEDADADEREHADDLRLWPDSDMDEGEFEDDLDDDEDGNPDIEEEQ